jgi:hypothetical protein
MATQGAARIYHPHRGQAGEEGVRERRQPARQGLGPNRDGARDRAGTAVPVRPSGRDGDRPDLRGAYSPLVLGLYGADPLSSLSKSP